MNERANMSLRLREVILVGLGVAVVLWPSGGVAQDVVGAVGDAVEGITTRPIELVALALVQSAKSWIPIMQGYARTVFLALATIQIGWSVLHHAMSGEPQVGGALGTALREFVVLGFFAILIDKGPDWGTDIILSLQEAGRVAAGGSGGTTPQHILDAVAELGTKTIVDSSLLSLAQSGFGMAIGGFTVLVCVALIGGLSLVGWAQAWVVLGAGSILLGFGGSGWTRSLAVGYLRHALGAGIKLMTLELMQGLLLAHIKLWIDKANGDLRMELLVTIIVSCVVMIIMMLTIPAYVSSIVTGAVMHAGETAALRTAAAGAFLMGQMAAARAASAAVGAAAGASGGAGAGAGLPATGVPGLVGKGGPSPLGGGGGGAAQPRGGVAAAGGDARASSAAAGYEPGGLGAPAGRPAPRPAAASDGDQRAAGLGSGGGAPKPKSNGGGKAPSERGADALKGDGKKAQPETTRAASAPSGSRAAGATPEAAERDATDPKSVAQGGEGLAEGRGGPAPAESASADGGASQQAAAAPAAQQGGRAPAPATIQGLGGGGPGLGSMVGGRSAGGGGASKAAPQRAPSSPAAAEAATGAQPGGSLEASVLVGGGGHQSRQRPAERPAQQALKHVGRTRLELALGQGGTGDDQGKEDGDA